MFRGRRVTNPKKNMISGQDAVSEQQRTNAATSCSSTSSTISLGAWNVWVLFFAALVLAGMDQNPIAVALQSRSGVQHFKP